MLNGQQRRFDQWFVDFDSFEFNKYDRLPAWNQKQIFWTYFGHVRFVLLVTFYSPIDLTLNSTQHW